MLPKFRSQGEAHVIPQFDLTRQHHALAAELEAALGRVVRSGRFVLGPEGEALEGEVARFCGTKYAVGVASGSDALKLSLEALGVGAGDEVITTSFSFVSTATAILQVGARPVFVDIDPESLNLDGAQVEAAITSRTVAILPVHLFGLPAEMEGLRRIALRHGLALVEDAAQAFGATFAARRVGTLGDAACLSFFPTKLLGGGGDGGMVVTDRADLAERIRRLRSHGAEEKYHHVELGWNSRLDELQAAFLRVKLPHVERWIEGRRRLAARYTALLADLPLGLPRDRPPARHVYHQFTIRSRERDALAKHLQSRGIGTALHYPLPLPAQPIFRARGHAADAMPQAWAAAQAVLSLPCFPELREDEVGTVAAAIHDFYR